MSIGLYIQGGLGGRRSGGHSNPGLAFSALEKFAPGTTLKGKRTFVCGAREWKGPWCVEIQACGQFLHIQPPLNTAEKAGKWLLGCHQS